MLAYQVGDPVSGDSRLTWFDHTGKSSANFGPVSAIRGLSLSPDGKTVALSRGSIGESDIWLHDIVRGVETRFTLDASGARTPVWSPDGRRLLYSALRGAHANLYLKEASGTSPDQPLLKPGVDKYATDWSRDGRTILYHEQGPKGSDIWTLHMDDEKKSTPFAQTAFNEAQGQFSPDGRWVAYASDESGRFEIYIRPFPSGPGKWKISVNGGGLPRWHPDGKGIFFVGEEAKLLFTSLTLVSGPQPVVSAGVPKEMFEAKWATAFNNYPYAVSPDGNRILIRHDVSGEPRLTVVINWLAGVRR